MGHRRVCSWISSNRVRNCRELTRPFSQRGIMEMECNFLISNFKDEKTIAPVKENIRHISDGSSSHSAGALHLGLEKAFELKKQKRQPSGSAMLRCPRAGCSWHDNHVSCSYIGLNALYCQVCRHTPHGKLILQCASCGYSRTGNGASCQGCTRQFV